jgi:cystathionine gamma-synthase
VCDNVHIHQINEDLFMADYQKETYAVKSGIATDTQFGSVVPPIYLSTNYTFAGFGEKRQFDYGRSGNPTRNTLTEALSALEGGAGAVFTGSGMGAINLTTALLSAGDLLIAPHDCYGGTYRLFQYMAARGSYRVLFIDQTDDRAVEDALAQQPKMFWIETPSNPLLRVVDIAKISQLAHQVGALVVADNTFLTPLLQQPLQLGADIVVHSTTKYLNGHSDVIGGAVISATQELHDKVAWWGNCMGHTGSPFDAYLTLRGLRTLAPRMRLHQENATAFLAYLQSKPAVKAIYHPGLPNHPGHDVAAKQQKGYGAMLSFELDYTEDQLRQFLGGLRLFCLAESLGGVESLIAHPGTMTHAGMSAEARYTAGISDQLLRLSIGLEHIDDLIADFEHAFSCVAG